MYHHVVVLAVLYNVPDFRSKNLFPGNTYTRYIRWIPVHLFHGRYPASWRGGKRCVSELAYCSKYCHNASCISISKNHRFHYVAHGFPALSIDHVFTGTLFRGYTVRYRGGDFLFYCQWKDRRHHGFMVPPCRIRIVEEPYSIPVYRSL